MLRKLFAKNETKSLEVKQDWDQYFCRIEDKPASIRLNLALGSLAPIKDCYQQIWFSVKLMNPDANGFTTSEEFDTICAIEDSVLNALDRKYGCVFAGAVKTDGRLDLYVYSQLTKGVESVVGSIMQSSFPDYRYALDVKEDRDWEDYHHFLYPNSYEFQVIQNRRVIEQLEQSGDNPEIKRLVDHFVVFKDEVNLNNFIDKAVSKGFQVLNKGDLDNHEFKYSVNIAREDVVVLDKVNDYVFELVELAEENNGEYDGWGCPVAK